MKLRKSTIAMGIAAVFASSTAMAIDHPGAHFDDDMGSLGVTIHALEEKADASAVMSLITLPAAAEARVDEAMARERNSHASADQGTENDHDSETNKHGKDVSELAKGLRDASDKDAAHEELVNVASANAMNDKDKLDDIHEEADDAIDDDDIEDNADEARDHAADEADEARDHATDEADEARDHATDEADEARDHAADEADEAKDHASDEADEARDNAEAAAEADEARDNASHTG